MSPEWDEWFRLRGMAVTVCSRAQREDVVIPDEIGPLIDELVGNGSLLECDRDRFGRFVDEINNELAWMQPGFLW